jgi:hypothetical protein
MQQPAVKCFCEHYRVEFDEAGNVIETHEQVGQFQFTRRENR